MLGWSFFDVRCLRIFLYDNLGFQHFQLKNRQEYYQQSWINIIIVVKYYSKLEIWNLRLENV